MRINLLEHSAVAEYEISESGDIAIFADISSTLLPPEGEWNIRLNYMKPNISSSVSVRLINRTESTVKLFVTVFAPVSVSGVSSTLAMRGLLLGDGAILFTPSLEIDEMNVSVDHKSSIGAPEKAEMEYMMSRGLSYSDSVALLADGFMSNI